MITDMQSTLELLNFPKKEFILSLGGDHTKSNRSLAFHQACVFHQARVRAHVCVCACVFDKFVYCQNGDYLVLAIGKCS